MKNNIRELYSNNIQLIGQVDKIIHNLHIQNYDFALRKITQFIHGLGCLIDSISNVQDELYDISDEININNINAIITDLLMAQDNRDYVLLADLYEIQLKPYLYLIQKYIVANYDIIIDNELYINNSNLLWSQWKEKYNRFKSIENMMDSIDDRYILEPTESGVYTLGIEDNNKKYYFHSIHNPQKESYELAKSWYKSEECAYIIYGLGLGYHIKELAELTKGIKIEVYESDINIIELSCGFTKLEDTLQHSNVYIIYDPTFEKLSKRLMTKKETEQLLIHYPSLRNIQVKSVREEMENYFIQYSSLENQITLLNDNFKSNSSLETDTVDVLRDKFYKKDLYIIAAGPSLDKNFRKLKELSKDSIILATGTVFKKLLNEGIIPDYVIVTDANERVYNQIRDFEKEQVSMLFLSTAFKGFAQNYEGPKYMILQEGYEPAEVYAKEIGGSLFKTGGSVSTVALEVGIVFQCKRIVFVGLDLAYTNNFVHAEGTSRRNLASTDDLRQVEDINGNMTYTNKSLEIYRKWIEDRIKDINNIEIVDATEGGAKIKGMKIVALDDILRITQ